MKSLTKLIRAIVFGTALLGSQDTWGMEPDRYKQNFNSVFTPQPLVAPDLVVAFFEQAIKDGNIDEVHTLIAAHPDINNILDRDKYTPLHFAALCGQPKIAQLLVDSGADTNRQNIRGETPTHLAIWEPDFFPQKNRICVLRILLTAGADPSIKNRAGKTALDIVRERGCSVPACSATKGLCYLMQLMIETEQARRQKELKAAIRRCVSRMMMIEQAKDKTKVAARNLIIATRAKRLAAVQIGNQPPAAIRPQRYNTDMLSLLMGISVGSK